VVPKAVLEAKEQEEATVLRDLMLGEMADGSDMAVVGEAAPASHLS